MPEKFSFRARDWSGINKQVMHRTIRPKLLRAALGVSLIALVVVIPIYGDAGGGNSTREGDYSHSSKIVFFELRDDFLGGTSGARFEDQVLGGIFRGCGAHVDYRFQTIPEESLGSALIREKKQKMGFYRHFFARCSNAADVDGLLVELSNHSAVLWAERFEAESLPNKYVLSNSQLPPYRLGQVHVEMVEEPEHALDWDWSDYSDLNSLLLQVKAIRAVRLYDPLPIESSLSEEEVNRRSMLNARKLELGMFRHYTFLVPAYVDIEVLAEDLRLLDSVLNAHPNYLLVRN